jgi:hypothetical protein
MQNRNARGVADREHGFDLKRPEETGKRARHARQGQILRRAPRVKPCPGRSMAITR